MAGACVADLIGVVAALGAAFCWTLASALWRSLPTSLGPVQLNLIKNLVALGFQLPLLLLLHQGMDLTPPVLWLVLSGVLGIAVGDSLYFAALRRLGTRRTLTIDAGGPALTALAGAWLLAELPAPHQGLGIALISLAVGLVARQKPLAAGPLPDLQRGGGVVLALGALFCGGAGALLSRAALREALLTPLQSATIRLAAAALVLLPLLARLPGPGSGPRPSRTRWPRVLLATLLGTSAGIVLQQLALERLEGGVAVALLATAPVMALPLAGREGDQPGQLGRLAALLALTGVTLVAI
ncbi:MAG: DMT family transporter [Cyanobacteriota bacterium]|nr:DMT family transporter [Cyanobacteriota bacterium]